MNTIETDDEILARLVKEKFEEEDVPFEFDGQNCHDAEMGEDCTGWDGEDNRCECGNRRVAWVLSDDKQSVYAEAY